jgi:hypothetical protein
MPFDKQKLEDFKKFREEIVAKDEIKLRLLPQPLHQYICIYTEHTVHTIDFECAETNFSFYPAVSVTQQTDTTEQHFITYYDGLSKPAIKLRLRTSDFLAVKSLADGAQTNSINLSINLDSKRPTPHRMYFTGAVQFSVYYESYT